MASLRTPESSQRYKDHIASGELEKGCPLCEEEGKQSFMYWKIMKNDFPYDKIAATHDMIVPLRHIAEPEMTEEEYEELQKIKSGYIDSHYEWIMESTHQTMSIPAHYHLHLIVVKE